MSEPRGALRVEPGTFLFRFDTARFDLTVVWGRSRVGGRIDQTDPFHPVALLRQFEIFDVHEVVLS